MALRALAVLGEQHALTKSTCRHPTPFMLDRRRPAPTCHKMGVPEVDFNPTQRTAATPTHKRATFRPTPSCLNEMVCCENGQIKQGSLGAHSRPEGTDSHACGKRLKTYMERKGKPPDHFSPVTDLRFRVPHETGRAKGRGLAGV